MADSLKEVLPGKPNFTVVSPEQRRISRRIASDQATYIGPPLPEDHDLHIRSARIMKACLQSFPNCEVLLDSRDCGGDHLIEMFCDDRKTNASQICEVDAVIVVNGQVKVIIEIDGDDKPRHLCGKLDITTYATLASYGCDDYSMADSISFIQILAAVTKSSSSKSEQRRNIQNVFQKRLAECSFGRIRHYQILEGTDELSDRISLAVSR